MPWSGRDAGAGEPGWRNPGSSVPPGKRHQGIFQSALHGQDSIGIKTMIKVLLADDHSIVRAGLRRIVEESKDMRVIAEAADGRDAIEQVHKTSPDIAIIDISMPASISRTDRATRSSLRSRWSLPRPKAETEITMPRIRENQNRRWSQALATATTSTSP